VCLLFLRDTRSRTYFEQMKGRGTRVLSATDLQSVSGATPLLNSFVIVDAVGVCEATSPTPAARTPADRAVSSTSARGGARQRDEDTLTTLAGRLARLDREIGRKGCPDVA